MTQHKRKWLRYGAVGLFLVLAYFANVAIQSHLGRKVLANSGLEIATLDAALAKAKIEKKPVLADVSAIWCPNCRRLDKKVLSHPLVRQTIAERYVFARLEYESDEGQAFLVRHGLQGFPNLVILDEDGHLQRKLRVVFEPESFLKQL